MTIECQMIDGMVVLILAVNVEELLAHRERMHTDDDACAVFVMYMVQMNVWVKLGNPDNLQYQEAGKPPTPRQWSHRLK